MNARQRRARRLGCRLGGLGDDQRAAGIAQQAAGDLVGAGHELGGKRLGEPGCDVLALRQHHHAVQDLPLDRAVGLVDDPEGGPAGRHGQSVGLASLAGDGHRVRSSATVERDRDTTAA